MVGADPDFDPSRFELGRKQAGPPTRRRARRNQKFVMVPAVWAEQLAAIHAHGSAYRVALYLLYESWQTRSSTLKLTNVALAKIGVSRRGKMGALRELRKAGLIAVEEREKRSPVVTLRYVS
jgi:hypothetical protein